jgi:hypothetical protein
MTQVSVLQRLLMPILGLAHLFRTWLCYSIRALSQIDAFILETRRKSGQQTEKSVLSLWQVRISHSMC